MFWYSWTGKPSDENRDFTVYMGTEYDTVIAPPKMLQRQFESCDGLPGTCSVLVRRAIAEEVGAFEESFPGMYEEEVFFSKIALRFPAYIVRELLDKYRQHPNSFCARAIVSGGYNMGSHNPARLVFLRWLNNYIKASEFDDQALHKSLRDQIAHYV